MTGKYVAREIEPGRWALDYVTSVGMTSGYTTFPNSDAAVAAAHERDPSAEVEVLPLQK